MGFNDPVSLDETMAHSVDAGVDTKATSPGSRRGWHTYLAILLLFAAAVYLACIVSPPSLMDDVDAVQGQIARNMLDSGDWVTARLDGIIYLEKSPLIYWLMAISYKLFGAYDWAARIPIALSSIGLAWLTAAFGRWAFGVKAGFLCRSLHGNRYWPFSLYARPDSGRHADLHYRACDVGLSCACWMKRKNIPAPGPIPWPQVSA